MKKTLFERLAETSPNAEIWWDSSPLVYPTWAKMMNERAKADNLPHFAEAARRYFNEKDMANSLFTGVTTNPPLSLNAMKDNPARWEKWIKTYTAEHPDADYETVFWALYKVIVQLGAQALQPIFEKSGYTHGHISGQVDPRYPFDRDLMLRQALELAALEPNVMVKIPGTTEGMWVLEELTARGIATNCTMAFVVPQWVQVAEAVNRGLKRARVGNVDMTKWRSVVTAMSFRWEAAADIDQQAEAAGITITPEDKRWGSIALFKHAYEVFRKRAYHSKMLICSLRVGPKVDGKDRVWHLEETAGSDVVFTCPPTFITECLEKTEYVEFGPKIWEPIPEKVMDKLRRLEYFNKSYEVDGMGLYDFNLTLTPMRMNQEEFARASWGMVDFVRERMPKK